MAKSPHETSEADKAKLEREKLSLEIHHLNDKAGKTNKEIAKLQAEIELLQTPFRRTPQFWTVLFSGIAAFATLLGIPLQYRWHKQELARDQASLKEEKRESDKLLSEIRKEKVDLTAQKVDVDTAAINLKKNLLEAENKLALADDQLRFAAFLAMAQYDRLTNLSSTDSVAGELARSHLADFLDSLEKYRFEPQRAVSLLSYNDSSTADVRRVSALILSRLKKERIGAIDDRTALARQIVDALVREPHLETKRLEVKAIAKLGRAAIPPLLDRLKSEPDEEVRYNIVRALGELGDEADEKVVKALVPYLKEDDKLLKRQVAAALGEIGTTAVAGAEDELVRQLPENVAGLVADSETYFLSRQIISTLGKIHAKKPGTVDRLLPFFTVRSDKEDDPLVYDLRKELLISLGAIGPSARGAAEEITKIINVEKKNDVLEEAAIALGKIGDTAEVKRLLKADDRLARAGLVALTAIRVQDRKVMLKELLDARKDPFLSPSAIQSLKNRGPEALPLLVDAAGMVTNVFVRENLARTIGEVVAPGEKDTELAITALIDCLQDANNYVQTAAIKGLERIGPKSDRASVAIHKIAVHPNTNDYVRKVAQEALFSAIDGILKKGILNKHSINDKDKYYNSHKNDFEQGYIYRIDLISTAFDAFLYVKKGDDTLAYDDDSGGNLNARIFFEPAMTGEYEIRATSYNRNAVGAYTLEIRKLAKSIRK